jgi:hypothetical protein
MAATHWEKTIFEFGTSNRMQAAHIINIYRGIHCVSFKTVPRVS